MARAVLLALVACLALGVAQAQLPLEFLDQLLLTGKDVLTEEQAAMAAGEHVLSTHVFGRVPRLWARHAS